MEPVRELRRSWSPAAGCRYGRRSAGRCRGSERHRRRAVHAPAAATAGAAGAVAAAVVGAVLATPARRGGSRGAGAALRRCRASTGEREPGGQRDRSSTPSCACVSSPRCDALACPATGVWRDYAPFAMAYTRGAGLPQAPAPMFIAWRRLRCARGDSYQRRHPTRLMRDRRDDRRRRAGRIPRRRRAAGGAFHPVVGPAQLALPAMRARADGPARAARGWPRRWSRASPPRSRDADRRGRLAGDGRRDRRARDGARAGRRGDVPRAARRHVRAAPRLPPGAGAAGADDGGRRHHRAVARARRSRRSRRRAARRSRRRRWSIARTAPPISACRSFR